MTEEKQKTFFIAFLELIKGALWPLLILYLTSYFGPNLRDLLVGLQPMLSRAQSFEIAGFKVSLTEVKLAQAPSDLAAAQQAMTPSSIRELLTYTNEDHRVCMSYKSDGKREIMNIDEDQQLLINLNLVEKRIISQI